MLQGQVHTLAQYVTVLTEHHGLIIDPRIAALVPGFDETKSQR